MDWVPEFVFQPMAKSMHIINITYAQYRSAYSVMLCMGLGGGGGGGRMGKEDKGIATHTLCQTIVAPDLFKFAVGCCVAENVTSQSGTTYIWPQIFGRESATFTCPLSPEFTVTRSCQFGGVWQQFDEDGCGVVNGQLTRLENIFNNVRKSQKY